MKICIKENELNWNYHEIFGEEKAIQDGYTIFEVPQGYEDCAFEDFDSNGFNEELYRERKRIYSNQMILGELINWFDNYFEKQLIQSQWQDDFKPSKDPYFKDENEKPRIYADLEELKAQAEIVRVLINSLRNEV